MQIAFGDGIFTCCFMFVRPQQQVLWAVLNSYKYFLTGVISEEEAQK